MTRAKRLICLAIKKESVSNKDRKDLCAFGWHIEEL